MDSLKEGWPDSEYAAYTQTYYGYPAAYWGFINSNKNNILRHIDNGVDWWFWDMPFWGRWSRHTDREHYWHVAKNNIYPTLVHDCPSDRFDASGLKPKPYKSGEYILICPSSDTMTRWVTGEGDKDWVEDTVTEIKKYTDRPIKIRYKPRANGISGPDAEILTGMGSVHELFEDAHCVVTTVSLVAFEAQLAGVPTFCNPKSFAVEVSETNLSKIETPKQADRQPWFNWLGYNQFTEKEIRSGFAYETLKNQ
jgi:hypothetical protein